MIVRALRAGADLLRLGAEALDAAAAELVILTDELEGYRR